MWTEFVKRTYRLRFKTNSSLKTVSGNPKFVNSASVISPRNLMISVRSGRVSQSKSSTGVDNLVVHILSICGISIPESDFCVPQRTNLSLNFNKTLLYWWNYGDCKVICNGQFAHRNKFYKTFPGSQRLFKRQGTIRLISIPKTTSNDIQ